MTIRQAQAILRPHGIVLRWMPEYGEYRVNFRGGHERTAYYTNDRDDAVATGRDMARRQPRENPGVPKWNTPGHIPGEALEVKYRRGAGKYYSHTFRPGVRQRRNANGSITLYHPKHRLWADDREHGFWDRYGDGHNPRRGGSRGMDPWMKYALIGLAVYLIIKQQQGGAGTATVLLPGGGTTVTAPDILSGGA